MSDEMKKQYDFSKGRKNPYAGKLNKQKDVKTIITHEQPRGQKKKQAGV